MDSHLNNTAMSCQTVNVSTGPVQISKQVLRALAAPPVSHRSPEFQKLHYNTTDFLCKQFKVEKTYLLTGSGTAANEAMIWQIKLLRGKGLILSNGEFGTRLIEQATRASLQFIQHKLLCGQGFELCAIENEIHQNEVTWILFCHCETSTGVVNDLDNISKICRRNDCLCFVDCMSTAGTQPLDLSRIAIATASSGKGLASVPGLAIIFSNIEIISSNQTPVYFDLAFNDNKDGIPFTISSNLLHALNVSMKQKLQQEQFELIDSYSESCHKLFSENDLLPFNNTRSKVFTISSPHVSTNTFINHLKREGVIVSYESEYLKKRDWLQVALFGYYKTAELDYMLKTLKKTMLASSATNICHNWL